VTQAAKKICDIYGHDAVSGRVVQSWFKRFQSGNFVKAALCCDQVTGKVDEIIEEDKQDRHISSRDIRKKHRSQNSFKLFGEG